jgi:glycerol-3-phosphate acyltransferase PlsX
MLAVLLKQEISASWLSRLGYLFSRRAFASFKKRVDYAEYGGMPLLGVRGGAIICHGRSSPKAIMNAVRVAAEVVQHRVDDRIQDVLARRHQLQAV